MLEVMEERHITVDGDSHAVPRPFVVIATQNPIEQEGTYRLPEAQLDRFLLRTALGYPDHDAEIDAVRRVTDGATSEGLAPVISLADTQRMIDVARGVHVDDAIYDYIVRLVAATRELPELRLGASTRGGLALVRASPRDGRRAGTAVRHRRRRQGARTCRPRSPHAVDARGRAPRRALARPRRRAPRPHRDPGAGPQRRAVRPA